MEQQPQSAGDTKVNEYVTRIKSGESKDLILEGLSPSFIASINSKLALSDDINASSVEAAEKSPNPPINYIEIVIDDEYMRENLMPGGGLRMRGGQAN